MYKLLQGLRLIEGSAFIAAPLGGMTLAQLGADVIRFDMIGGGLDYRRWPVTRCGASLYWAGPNKCKRSIAVNLRAPEGRELVAALITCPGEGGGLFLTNLPAGPGLDFENLRLRRADLIMLSLLGNADGTTAIDYTVNCSMGFPFVAGDASPGRPVNHVLPAWDLVTGMTAAIGLLAALYHRRLTGQGQHIKLALSDVAIAITANLGFAAEVEVNRTERRPVGNDIYGSFGRDFGTKDGRRIMVAAMTVKQWHALCRATGVRGKMILLE